MKTTEISAIKEYELSMEAPRLEITKNLLPLMLRPEPKLIGLFLINFCSLGVGMTEFVPDWIKRAGLRSIDKGFKNLGTALTKHAEHEAGHHELMRADTRSLVEWWNARFPEKLDAEKYLSQPLSPGVLEYQKLHEDYIESDTPYVQISIEYEIEKISVSHGPQLFGFCSQNVGPEILAHLSFLSEHMAVDVGHTQYNAHAMDRFMTEFPNTQESLVQAGTKALEAYGHYLKDCFDLALAELMTFPKEATEIDAEI